MGWSTPLYPHAHSLVLMTLSLSFLFLLGPWRVGEFVELPKCGACGQQRFTILLF